MKKWLWVIAITSLLAACADTHQLIRNEASPSTLLTSSDTNYIAVPKDGAYGATIYSGSGQNTAQIIYSSFAKHTHDAKVGRSTQSFDEALKSASSGGQKYLVYPIVLHWEDRATEWSGISDKIEIKVELVDVATGSTITSAIVKGKSGLATFGGDHPQDLLSEPVEEFVSSLY